MRTSHPLVSRGLPLAGGLAALALLAPGAVVANPTLTNELDPLAAKHAPAPEPDRIVATLDGDPATSRAVSWRTDDSVLGGELQFAPLAAWTPDAESVQTVPAQTTALDANLGYTNHQHTVSLGELEPDTAYMYRVGDVQSDTWSRWIEFETASSDSDAFDFAYIGDAQNDIEAEFSRVAQRVYGLDPELVVHPGDLIDVSDRDQEWGEWTSAISARSAETPWLVSPGNHEYFQSDGSRSLSEHWRLQFALPQNGPEGHEDYAGTVYSTDYQGVRFISLNSARNEAEPGDTEAQAAFLDAQTEWLEDQLQDNPNAWTVVFFHHPTYSTAEGRDNPDVRERWKPLFEDYGVDLVLSGHDHTYGRGYTNDSRQGRRMTGPMYVNSVSGPKMYDVSGQVWRANGATPVRTGEFTQLYHLVRVDGDRLEFHGYTAAGDWYDGFRLQRQSRFTNRVTELDERASVED